MRRKSESGKRKIVKRVQGYKKERKNTKSMRRKLARGKRKKIECVQRCSKILETYSANEVKIGTLEKEFSKVCSKILKNIGNILSQ